VSLDKAFELISELKNLRVNIDVKETKYLEKIPPLAEKYGITDRIFFTGIGKNDVAAVKEKCPGIPYYLNLNVIAHASDDVAYFDSVITALKESGAIGLNTIRLFVTPALVKAVQEAGFLVSVWTATTAEEIRKAAHAGPNNITTKNPELAYKICR
ncbi:MAG: glycerophosphodiester phosphodiesterase, partial [Clostridia bacterium]|nr:glycerophosphodiester phosphodiesterase [Clostridia bacterium]